MQEATPVELGTIMRQKQRDGAHKPACTTDVQCFSLSSPGPRSHRELFSLELRSNEEI